MRIEADSSVPIFQQIVEGIRSAISAGVYRPGEMIPSVRQQAVASMVNPNTVQRAYEHLEREGLVVSKKGTGMAVAENALALAQKEIHRGIKSIFAQAIALGRNAQLSREAIDKLYRQAMSEAGGKREVSHAGR